MININITTELSFLNCLCSDCDVSRASSGSETEAIQQPGGIKYKRLQVYHHGCNLLPELSY